MKAKRKNLGDTLRLHVRNQMSLYLFITVLFMMGVVFGAVVVNTLSPEQKEGLLEYLGYFFRGLEQNTIAEPEIAFQHSMGNHLKNLGLMWMLGLSIIGIPLILLLIFLKGLVIGFTVGFLVSQLSWRGLWFAFLSVVPQNLLVVPAMIIIAVSGIHFSLLLVRNRLIFRRGSIYPEFLAYSGLVMAMSVVLVFASLVESYLSPVLMRMAVPPVGMVN